MLPSRKNKQLASKGKRLRWPLVKDVKPLTIKSLDIKPIKVKSKAGKPVSDGGLLVDPKPRPRYTLAELLLEAEAAGAYPLPAEEREWVDAPAVGRELI